MTIKQQGGIFGRNPTFNDVDVDNDLTVSGTFTSNGANLNGSVVINEAGADVDFRVESDTNPNALFLEGSTGKIGAGTNSPNGFVEIVSSATGDVLALQLSNSSGAGSDSATLRFRNSSVATSSSGGSEITGIRDAALNGGSLLFKTASSVGTLTERVKIDSSGNATINAGNLVIGTSGKGIDFSATSGTGTSELFDDYEEGNYTGTLTPSTSGSITVNSLANYMSYTKIGRVVNIHGFLEVGSVSSPVGTYVSLNLPFTIISLPDDGGRFGSACRVGSNLQAVYALNGASTASILVDASTIGAATQFWFSFSYMAA